MLETDSVTLCFGDREILSGCYISCRNNEVVGLLGRNGCGKSSLLKIIFGTLKAGFMHQNIDGRIMRKAAYRGQNVALLPQHNFIPQFLKVEKVLSDCDAEVLTDEVKERFRLLLDQRLASLSGGELRFLECLWLLSRPSRYLLLDEPFSEIAPYQIEILQDIIHRKSKSHGIILTDQFYRPLLEVSNRVLLMHNKSIYNIKNESDLVLYNYISEL